MNLSLLLAAMSVIPVQAESEPDQKCQNRNTEACVLELAEASSGSVQEGNLIKYSPEAGIYIIVNSKENTIEVSISSEWCIMNGVTNAVCGLYSTAGEMLICEIGSNEPAGTISMDFMHSAWEGAICKIFMLNTNWNPVCNDICWEIQRPQEDELPEEKYPWENGGKLPSEYTLEEYEALTGAQQMAFHRWFEDDAAFDAWMENAQTEKTDNPWENGGKQPNEYTMEEYEALTEAQQMAFFNWFENVEAFDAWLQAAQSPKSDHPWDNGGKLPDEYTWEEFEALTGAQQMAFQNWFKSESAFAEWMANAQSPKPEHPWENGGKLPNEYTWEEYEALTAAQQIAFQNWFDPYEAFENWMWSVYPWEM